jgi:hypothetical protein
MKTHIFITCGLLVMLGLLSAQEVRQPVKVTIKDGKVVVGEATLPVDPTQRIVAQFSSYNGFGLTLDGKRITCSPQGSIWSSIMVDGNLSDPFNENLGLQRMLQPKPLPPTASGRKRIGMQTEWTHQGVHITQLTEIVPSKPSANAKKRSLDTARITYVLENKTKGSLKVAFKTGVDILINNNDGALYASPTTEPGKVLNGVKLEGKTLPEYIWVLEQPNYAAPGMVATMTFKHSKGENPNKVVLSNLSLVGNFQVWDVPAQPAGDSACALFWEEKELKPGQKRELVWGYGGGISTSPENEGRVSIGLAGSFEPGKLFTIAAQVEDPVPDQVLAIDLPPGLERVEGREIEPVAAPGEAGSSMVLWKARVVRPGDYEIRVRSSSGTIQSKHVLIESVQPK